MTATTLVSDDKVDIIMATYNGSRYLAAQIDSILKQTHPNWQLYIRDDGSSDNTLEIIMKYVKQDTRIFLLKDQLGNLGFNKNFYHLLTHSQADYLCICDQDDVWFTNKIAKSLQQLKIIENTLRVPSLVHAESCVVDSNLNTIQSTFIGRRGRCKGLIGLFFANSAQGASIMINANLRKIALQHLPKLPYDYHLALLAELTGARFFIPQALMQYRQHASNIIGAGKNKHVVNKTKSLPASLLLSLNMYSHIKQNYASLAKDACARKQTEEYFYLFEGKNNLKKIYIFLKNSYPFYRRKDKFIFFKLLISGQVKPQTPHTIG